ncbi:hypothetical protein ACN4EK_08640 [Pantanalinema rosaneae CENA516]|uniref:hypothetical protein n=1 Tax=Leptolyngbyaceae TaxID=1890438 RepID=UPI000AD05206|nr:hypothetical protein [Leptolyngbya sp. 'hensonii']
MKKQLSTKTVSFRIDGQLAAKLNRQALDQRLSLHEYIRELFLDALSQQPLRDEVIELHSELRNISAEIDDLRHDLSVILQKFLMELADMDEDEARSWMISRLSSQGFQVADEDNALD